MTIAESPFLPDGRQWAWNSSTLSPAKECKRKYYYTVIEGWHLKSINADITFGAYYARSLETYHHHLAAGHARTDAVRETVRYALCESVGWQSDHPFKNRETLIRSLIWYFAQFAADPCATVILGDGRPAVELPFRFQLTNDIILCGHLDRIVSYADGYYIQDQKTTGSSLGTHYFRRYNPDNQMSLYTIAAEVVWKTPVKGVMIDAAEIKVGFTRFERGFTFRTPEQNAEWLRDAEYHIKETWNAAEAGWPMNDSACQKYGGCAFIEVCSKSPSVRQAFLETKYERRPTNPLETRINA